MIYTEQTMKAMRLCYHVHHGQTDKAGVPYVFHPIHLAEQMEDELTTVIALLHDVVEDTEYTLDDLRDMGFEPAVLEALRLLTHDPAVPYLDYVAAIRENPAARAVKLADLAHNSDVTRLPPQLRDPEREERYRQARKLLEE